jgi:hypothetical protein
MRGWFVDQDVPTLIGSTARRYKLLAAQIFLRQERFGGQSPISFFAIFRRKQCCPELGSDPQA